LLFLFFHNFMFQLFVDIFQYSSSTFFIALVLSFRTPFYYFLHFLSGWFFRSDLHPNKLDYEFLPATQTKLNSSKYKRNKKCFACMHMRSVCYITDKYNTSCSIFVSDILGSKTYILTTLLFVDGSCVLKKIIQYTAYTDMHCISIHCAVTHFTFPQKCSRKE